MPANVETMAYVGEVPWHGLGNSLPANPTVEQMRAAAGLTWEPELANLTFVWGGKDRLVKQRVMVRSDTGAVLDTVGPNYIPTQNAEVLEFFREYAEAGTLALETAGVLDNGRYVWALAKLKEGFTVHGKDRVEGYVLLANPHVFGKGGTAKLTATRVVCMNTLQMALAGGGAATKLWHTRAFDAARRAAVQRQMGIARDELATLEQEAGALANFSLKDARAQTLLCAVLRKEVPADWEKEAPKVAARIFTLYKGEAKGADLPSAKDTAWGLLNAVTQYVDHEKGKTVNTRTREAWFGSGSGLKNRARRVLVEAATKKKGA